MPALLVLVGLLRAVRFKLIGREDRTVAVSLTLAALFLAGAVIFYVPSANILLLMMALSGAAFGFLYRQGQAAAEETHSRVAYFASFVFLLVLVGLTAWQSAALARRLVAEAYVGLGTVALSANNLDAAINYGNKAKGVEATGDTLRFAATAGASKLRALAQDTTTEASTIQQQFATAVQDTLTVAGAAQAQNPHDYRPTLILAQVYDLLAQLKVQGADAQARAAYDAAAAKDPTNPQIPLLRARLEAVLGDGAAVQKQLQTALTLKPNYTDAMLFVVQLAIANNDLNTAVQAAGAAVQSAPGVPSLWFEYGLLLYSGNDSKDAVPALEQAVKLQADYANAKYFLGLAYWAQKNSAGAIQQFQDLAKSNPDNAEVKSILANMEAGKDPFAGATPPADTPPQKRTTAPVAQ